MLKKEEVLVRVSSDKKARKLKELLEMFGEKIWDSTNERLEKGDVSDEYPYVHFVGYEWSGISVGDTTKRKTKVSLKELRNILAAEHLKEGDVIVCKDGKEIALGVFKEWESQFGFELDNVYYTNDPDCNSQGNGGCFVNFIRYATEEEKSLLEPKKELEVGKWYKYTSGSLFFITDIKSKNVFAYGINATGEWSNECDWMCLVDYKDLSGFTEATPQEVEESLIKEAKRRYKVGYVIDQREIYTSVVRKKTIIGIEEFRFGHINKDSIEVLTGICAETVFKDGKWAEVIKTEKSLEERVKELEDAVLGNNTLKATINGGDIQFVLNRTKLR